MPRDALGFALSGALSYLNRGEVEHALGLLYTFREEAREGGHRDLEAYIGAEIGRAKVLMGQAADGAEELQGAVTLAKELGAPQVEAAALDYLGLALLRLGRLEEAITVRREAVARFRHIGDDRGVAVSLSGLGNVLTESGRYREAIEEYRIALEVLREVSDARVEAGVIDNLGVALRECGNFEAALEHHRMAATRFEALGDSSSAAIAIANARSAEAELVRLAPELQLGAIDLVPTSEHQPTRSDLTDSLSDTGFVDGLELIWEWRGEPWAEVWTESGEIDISGRERVDGYHVPQLVSAHPWPAESEELLTSVMVRHDMRSSKAAFALGLGRWHRGDLAGANRAWRESGTSPSDDYAVMSAYGLALLALEAGDRLMMRRQLEIVRTTSRDTFLRREAEILLDQNPE